MVSCRPVGTRDSFVLFLAGLLLSCVAIAMLIIRILTTDSIPPVRLRHVPYFHFVRLQPLR